MYDEQKSAAAISNLKTEEQQSTPPELQEVSADSPTPPPSRPPGFPAIGRLRLSQNFGAQAGVKQKLLTVPVRKWDRQTFFRVHHDEAYRLETMVLELKEEGEYFLLAPELWDGLAEYASPRLLVASCSRQNVVSLWPLRLPGPDGRLDGWARSALEAANLARTQWVRIAGNRSLGAYDVTVASGLDGVDPVWPDETFETLVQIAFKDRFIDSATHPVVRRLRGEI